ncbi:hypothetical protein DXG01_002774 [Tephrocybe rancida]|nr:hypothetical protein DXG01_002774 [Tephrocybe rancida]
MDTSWNTAASSMGDCAELVPTANPKTPAQENRLSMKKDAPPHLGQPCKDQGAGGLPPPAAPPSNHSEGSRGSRNNFRRGGGDGGGDDNNGGGSGGGGGGPGNQGNLNNHGLPQGMLPIQPWNQGGRGRGDVGGGGGGGGNPGAAQDAAAYRDGVPYVEEWTLNRKINTSTLPTWDGMDKTLIQYLGEMHKYEKLSLEWLPRSGLEGPLTGGMLSPWTLRTLSLQTGIMDKESHRRIQENDFLTKWILARNAVDYLQWRIKSHVYLYLEDEDSPAMVHRVLLLIPVKWTSHLNSVDCSDILELQSKALCLGASLVSLWEMMEASRHKEKFKNSFSTNNQSQARANGGFCNCSQAHTVHAVKGSEGEGEEEQEEDMDSDEHEAHVVGGRVRGTGSSAAKNCPPWPAGKTVNGYAFVQQDDISSLKAPNGECYICTSPRHFARDCPHYRKWDSLCNTNLVTSKLMEEQHQEWDWEYIAMLAESKASSVYEPEPMESMNEISETLDLPVDFDEEDLIKEVYTMGAWAMGAFALHARSIYVDNRNSQHCKTLEAKRKKGKEALVSSSILSRRQCRTKIRTNGFEGPSPVASAGKTAANADEEDKDKGRPSMSKIAEVITAIKGRSLPDGYSSLGRLDSGADITLMSEDYWKELANAPAIKEGIHMKLYHLMGHAKVLGYIKIPMYAATTDGKFISFELEAYIVRDMRVPLLLGEDFQTTYELGVTRFSSGHCEIWALRYGKLTQRVLSSGAGLCDVEKLNLAWIMVPLQSSLRKTCCYKLHQYTIALFGDQEHWLVEKVIIGLEDATVMTATTTFINSSTPYIPIANPNPRPWFIRKGEVVGYLVDPATTCDKPKDEDIFKYAASAEALRTVIEGSLRAQDLVNGIARDPPSEKDHLLNDENWGPKTTAMPEEPRRATWRI